MRRQDRTISRALRNRPAAGFSLIEILIGITISSLIIGSAYAAYLAVGGAWDRSRQNSRHYQYARVALDVIERYLETAMTPDEQGRIVFQAKNEGVPDKAEFQADSLLFVSTGGGIDAARANRVDLAQVELFLNQDPKRPELGLMMRKRTLPGDPRWGRRDAEEIGPDVVSFDARFFDGTQWVDDWTAAQALPKAVEVTLVFASPEGDRSPSRFLRLITLKMASDDASSSAGGGAAPNAAPGGNPSGGPVPEGAPLRGTP